MTSKPEHTPSSDLEIAGNVGDMEGFLARYATVAGLLETWARIRVHPPLRRHLDPEDLIQETCVRAFMSYGRYDERKGTFRAWLFAVANHVLLRELRRLKRSNWRVSRFESRFGAGAPGELRASLASVTEQAATREQIQALLGAAEELTGRDRWIFIFRGLEGLRYKEIATRLGLGEEAVRTRWRRLVVKLRSRPGLQRTSVA